MTFRLMSMTSQVTSTPREYDKRMQQIFNEEYYGKDEEVCDENLEKPVFSDSDDDSIKSDSSDYDNFPIGSAHEETGVENDKSSTKGSAKRNEGNGEEARSPGRIQSHRKRKRNSKFCEAVRRKSPSSIRKRRLSRNTSMSTTLSTTKTSLETTLRASDIAKWSQMTLVCLSAKFCQPTIGN